MPLSRSVASKNLLRMPGDRVYQTLICIVLFLLPATAFADQDIQVSVMGADGAIVTYEIALNDRPLDKILISMEEGLPTRIAYTTELWQERSRWFDKLVMTELKEFVLRHDPWSGGYELESDDIAERSFIEEEDLVLWLGGQGPMEIPFPSTPSPQNTFYLSVSAHVEPLSAEQVGAVERWLGGGEEESGGEGDRCGAVSHGRNSKWIPRWGFRKPAGSGARRSIARTARRAARSKSGEPLDRSTRTRSTRPSARIWK